MSSEKRRAPQPTTIFNITGGVHPAFAFLAGCQLDVFSPLKNGSLTAEEIAGALGVGVAKLRPLLYALVVAELLTIEDDRFANTEEANHFLVRESPAYIGGIHHIWSFMWDAELQTSASIESGLPQAKHDYEIAAEDELEQVLKGLHPGAVAAAYALLKRYDFSSYQTLLDVAGGSGGMAVTITEKHPDIQATIVDLPSVTPLTKKFVDKAGATERVQVVAKNVVREPLGGPYDVATARAFIQVLSREQAGQALKRISQALKPGGHIYILGAVLDNSRLSPPEMVALNLVFLNVYDEGQAYTEQEYRDWLNEAGFDYLEREILQDGSSILAAQKRA